MRANAIDSAITRIVSSTSFKRLEWFMPRVSAADATPGYLARGSRAPFEASRLDRGMSRGISSGDGSDATDRATRRGTGGVRADRRRRGRVLVALRHVASQHRLVRTADGLAVPLCGPARRRFRTARVRRLRALPRRERARARRRWAKGFGTTGLTTDDAVEATKTLQELTRQTDELTAKLDGATAAAEQARGERDRALELLSSFVATEPSDRPIIGEGERDDDAGR